MVVIDFRNPKTLQSVLPIAPLQAASLWEGMQVATHRQPAWETPSHHFVHDAIMVYTGQPIQAERRVEGQVLQGTYTSGKVGLFPAQMPLTLCWTGEVEFVSIGLDSMLLTEVDRYELLPKFAIDDPLIHGMGLSFKAALESGELCDRLYLESAATFLSVHLLQRYATQPFMVRFSGGLSRSQLKQVLEYIDAELGQDLSLLTLANLVQLSPNHFARQFKASTSLTPHRYVVQRRLAKAKRLLCESDASIVQVAQQVGLYDQSRLTKLFQKWLGVTPKQYRDQI